MIDLFHAYRRAPRRRRAELENIIATEIMQSGTYRRIVLGLAGPADPEERESAAGEALLRAIRSYDPTKADFFAYFRVVLRSVYTDQHRADLNRAALAATRRADEAAPPAQAWEELLEDVPEPTRRLLTLRFQRGYTCKEISEILSWPESTVRDRLKRALSRLRERNFGRK